MYMWVRLALGAGLLPLAMSAPLAGATDRDGVIAAAYGEFSISAPTPAGMTVCHGFGCKHRSEIAFGAADHAALVRMMAAGKASAAAERRAIGAAGAWFDRRIGPTAGTTRHVARAGYRHMFDKGQFDCIDTSRNMTGLLLLLEQLKLLRHHDVQEPQARGYLVDGRPPHVTAVLRDRVSGTEWAVDPWTRGYGQRPEIMPLAVWMTLD